MNKSSRKVMKYFVSICMISIFTAFAFGQASEIAGSEGQPDVIRVLGWIAIVIAAVTHTAMNIYNMIRGKNYEQLQETMSNYKGLAESRLAMIGELTGEVSHIRAQVIRLEFENERLAEQVLRK